MKRALAIYSLGLALLAAGTACQRAQAQSRSSVREMLDLIDRGERGLVPGYSPSVASTGLENLISFRDSLPQATVDSVLRGLDSLAHSEDERVRSQAVSILVGLGDREMPDPLPGVVNRLLAILASSSDPLLKAQILGAIPSQQERNAAIPFLRRTASAPEQEQPFSGAADAAIRALAELGRPGTNQLQLLYERRLLPGVRDSSTWLLLNDLARKHGWHHRGH